MTFDEDFYSANWHSSTFDTDQYVSLYKYDKIWETDPLLTNVNAHKETFCVMVHFSQKHSNPRSSLNLYRAVPQSFITKVG